MKKLTLLILTLLTMSFFACGTKETEEVTNETKNKSNWPKTIVDAGGNQVTIDKKPERVAVLHSLYLEYFFALETPPIASAGSSIGNAMKAVESWETLKNYRETGEIIDLGSARELNLEAILNSNPDVIVTFKGHGGVDKIYDQLNQIAPVVLIDYSASWQEQTLAIAEIIDKVDLANKIIKETEDTIAKTKEAITNVEENVALMRFRGKTFMTYGTKDYYDTFNLKKPNTYPDDYQSISLEGMAEMNPDYIVFQEYFELTDAFIKSQEQFDLWNNLDAVKNNRIIYFDNSLNTMGPISMKLTAEKYLDLLK